MININMVILSKLLENKPKIKLVGYKYQSSESFTIKKFCFLYGTLEYRYGHFIIQQY